MGNKSNGHVGVEGTAGNKSNGHVGVEGTASDKGIAIVRGQLQRSVVAGHGRLVYAVAEVLHSALHCTGTRQRLERNLTHSTAHAHAHIG